MNDHTSVLVLGGGTAGIRVAARLRNLPPSPPDVTLVEPSDEHYYQPLWTLVGGGVFDKSITVRDEADDIPDGVTWIKDRVAKLVLAEFDYDGRPAESVRPVARALQHVRARGLRPARDVLERHASRADVTMSRSSSQPPAPSRSRPTTARLPTIDASYGFARINDGVLHVNHALAEGYERRKP